MTAQSLGKVTAPGVMARKRQFGSEPLVMVTAYDTPFAHIVDEAQVDMILVGDSVANNVLGLERTLEVDLDAMVHHVAAVARARPRALVVADLPWMTYQVDPRDAVLSAARLVRAGAEAVKLEGGNRRLPAIRAILDADIPVMGHLGLTPQSVYAMGGLKVQARDAESAHALILDAKALAGAGCFAIVLEGVPRSVGAYVTVHSEVPIIGIGAGPDCDGQVLVLHDLLGINDAPTPKFVRRYLDLHTLARDAIESFGRDVRIGAYPSDEESYHAASVERATLEDSNEQR